MLSAGGIKSASSISGAAPAYAPVPVASSRAAVWRNSTGCSVACVRGDDETELDVWYFLPKLPELNPVEGCWDRLNEWFKHRLIPDLSMLKQQIQRGLETVDEPNIWNYLCP